MNSLESNIRENKTKGELNAIRNNGNVPAIIYGGKDKNQKVSISKKLLKVLIDKENLLYLIPKASILLNGVSLTISKVTKKGFQVWLIPHSLKLTNLSDLKKGQIVNVEIDILSKYIKKHYGKK